MSFYLWLPEEDFAMWLIEAANPIYVNLKAFPIIFKFQMILIDCFK